MLGVRFFACVLIAATCGIAQAVVINAVDGSGNTSPPADDPGFDNAGIIGSGTGIYLGNRWVLTANHVGPGSITIGGQQFDHLPAETVRLQNPRGKGLSLSTDLVLLRLEEDPGLPELRLGCRSPSVGSEVMLVGAGRDRSAAVSGWRITAGPGPSDDVWTSVDDLSLADEAGFKTSSSRSMRWGLSPVIGGNMRVATPQNGDVLSFRALFDEFSDADSMPEFARLRPMSRAVAGDSGGPVFQKNGQFWDLVGMIHGVSRPEENQPGGTSTVLFGSHTYVADLVSYADQIRAVADFGPQPGNFDDDGEIDADDIDKINRASKSGDPSCHFDLTGNGLVSRADVERLLELAGTLPGDTNLDGTVSFPDFLDLAREFGASNSGWAGGDFDGDGSTNFADFVIQTQRFGESFQGSTITAAVPEPTTSTLGFVFILTLASFGRTRSSIPAVSRGSLTKTANS